MNSLSLQNTKNPHLTLITNNNHEEEAFEALFNSFLSQIRTNFVPFAVNVKEEETFTSQNGSPVQVTTVEAHAIILHHRSLLEQLCVEMSLEWDTMFDYTPHVTLNDETFNGTHFILGAPQGTHTELYRCLNG